MPGLELFSPEVEAQLKTYVYRLIDPRNGETFYVGKGRGNRVFAHIREEENFEGEELDPKLERIREIRLAGFPVAHVIHRHGMDDRIALEVEAAVIDAYPGLANIAAGSGASDFGVAHAQEIIERYSAEPANLQHRAVLINVSRSASEQPSLYEATRFAWRMDKEKAEQAEVVLANRQGLIVEAFVPERWLDATTDNFPGRKNRPGRIGFEGRVAPPDIQEMYVRKRVPDEYRRPGAANPIRYTWDS
jgi:hypothetical protein